MKPFHLFLIAAIGLMFATSLRAGNVPDDFTAVYAISLNNFVIGESEIKLEAQPKSQYLYRSNTRSTGIARLFRSDVVEESSRFDIRRSHIRPLEYRFDHTGSKKQRHALLNFDWKKMQVANTVEGHTWEMEIPQNALDKLVVQIAVMADLAAGKQELIYNIADGGKLKEYRFSVVGTENIRVPAGEFEALKIERIRKDNDRTTYLWCAPSLNYLPVRIEQIEHEDDVTYLSELKQTTIGGQPPAEAQNAQ